MGSHRAADPVPLPFDLPVRGGAVLHEQDVRPLLLEVLPLEVQEGEDHQRQIIIFNQAIQDEK